MIKGFKISDIRMEINLPQEAALQTQPLYLSYGMPGMEQ
jgi:hypothetical protein